MEMLTNKKRISVGVSILTNARRCDFLIKSVESFLRGCCYRPLVIAVFDNGSDDNTFHTCENFSRENVYGVSWRYERADVDLGCAAGTNRSIGMIDNDIQLHLESDFRHVDDFDKMWLHRAVEFMETGVCDYLYLRKFRDDAEMSMHWFHQWKTKIVEVRGPFLKCDNFWWSNNPSLFRAKALHDCGTIPLRVDLDGPKNSPGWSKPELSAPRPTKAWMWGFGEGMFTHEG